MKTLLIALLILAIIIIAGFQIRLLNIKRKKREQKELDELFDPKTKALLNLFEIMSNKGTDQDIIPEGFGEFGLESTNPIPTRNIIGSKQYLEKLKTMDGKKIQYERQGHAIAKNIQDPIDIYEISMNGQIISTLFINPYNQKNSSKAPKGFKL